MSTQNGIGGNICGYYPPLAGAKYIKIYGSNLPTGDNDLYTVPAGKKCLIAPTSGLFRVWNPSVGSITYFPQIKVSSTYYKLAVARTATTLTGGTIPMTFSHPIVLSAGESISVNTTTTAGLNVWTTGIEFDADETRIQTARILSLSNGDNTLFTCPTDKSAFPLNFGTSNSVYIYNASGGTRTYITYVVPNGGSAGDTNKIDSSASAADQALYAAVGPFSLAAGDFVVVNTNAGTTTQTCWATFWVI